MSLSLDENGLHLLITGGAGFIGSNFIKYLLNNNNSIRITNLDKLTYAGNLLNLKEVEKNQRYNFVRGDISSRGFVDNLFEEEDFNAIINFAAESHVDRSLLDSTPFIRTNIGGTQVLLDMFMKHDLEYFIQISTDEVYGSAGEGEKFKEDSPLLPNSPYSASKASADLMCRAYFKSYDLPVIIVRSSNNYGPFQFPEKLIPLMVKNALEEKRLPVYGRGENVRDWLYVKDNCRAIYMILESGSAGEIYNVGGGAERRNIEVVKLICKIISEKTGKSLEKINSLIKYIKDPRGKAHDFRYRLDCTKIREDTGWNPEFTFEEGLEKTVDWYLNNEKWMREVITGEYREYYEKMYGDV